MSLAPSGNQAADKLWREYWAQHLCQPETCPRHRSRAQPPAGTARPILHTTLGPRPLPPQGSPRSHGEPSPEGGQHLMVTSAQLPSAWPSEGPPTRDTGRPRGCTSLLLLPLQQLHLLVSNGMLSYWTWSKSSLITCQKAGCLSNKTLSTVSTRRPSQAALRRLGPGVQGRLRVLGGRCPSVLHHYP